MGNYRKYLTIGLERKNKTGSNVIHNISVKIRDPVYVCFGYIGFMGSAIASKRLCLHSRLCIKNIRKYPSRSNRRTLYV